MRLRYYTSLEEIHLIELWRQNISAISVSSYAESLPVHRTIADGLLTKNIKMTKQEVRRRIASYRKKYMAEERRKQLDPDYQSDWHLYPLVSCIFKSDKMSPDVNHEKKVLEQIQSNISKELNLSMEDWLSPEATPVNIEHDPDSCPFFEDQQLQINEVKSKPEAKAATVLNQRVPLATANRIDLEIGQRRIDLPSLPTVFPVSEVTMAEIERLRQANDLLEKERDEQQKELKIKEERYLLLEETFKNWANQQATLLGFLNSRERN